jgi:hypothetical protein
LVLFEFGFEGTDEFAHTVRSRGVIFGDVDINVVFVIPATVLRHDHVVNVGVDFTETGMINNEFAHVDVVGFTMLDGDFDVNEHYRFS